MNLSILALPLYLLAATAAPAAREWPSDAAGLAELAAKYAEVEDPRAAEAYERAIAAAPGNLPLRVEFAEFLWHIRELDRGNSQMEAVIRRAPDNLKLKAHYGANLAAQGKYGQASEQLEAARRGGFDNADVLYYLGSALWETGQLDLAAARLSEAAAKAPQKAAIRHRLGRLLIFQGQPAAAVTELSRASELDPTSAEVLLDLGRALEASREIARAEAAYRRALELDPEGSLGHYLLGTLLARSGRREEAAEHVAHYRKAFQNEQERRFRAGSRQAELNLGWTKLKERRFEEALAQFNRHPDDVEALRGASQALSALGRHAEAVRALERARSLAPENPALRYALDRERERLEKK
ncbi:MAG TPA: tetratricopeptide repeat protein [Thermoanaerobaculia bacterium]|nr:tetratricopeptide repeat protein [Thermoanaerobaculia bacterium]